MVKLMTLDLKNVIGSFMLGSAIMYAGVNLLGHKKVCSNATRKNVKSILKSRTKNLNQNQPKLSTNLNQPKLSTHLNHPILQFTLVKTTNTIQNNTFGAYFERGNMLNNDTNRCLILSLAHILWVKTTIDYKNYSSSFYEQLKTEFKKTRKTQQILKSLQILSKKNGSSIDPTITFNKFEYEFLNNQFLNPDVFMSIFKLCKIKSLIFLHESDNNILNFDFPFLSGLYIGDIDENTPYIVNTGNYHFEPGVGKLNPQIIKLIKIKYMDITELQQNAPIEIDCNRTVRFTT